MLGYEALATYTTNLRIDWAESALIVACITDTCQQQTFPFDLNYAAHLLTL